MSEQEQEQPAAKKVRWWRRALRHEPGPRGRAIALWLIAGVALAGHLTHTKMNFNQGGIGQDEPVTWWIVGFWAVTAAFATFRWLRSRRHPAEPEPESQPLSPAQQRQAEATMWRRMVVVMGVMWAMVALLAREPMPVKLVLTALCALGTVTGVLIVRAVYRRRAESAEPEDQS